VKPRPWLIVVLVGACLGLTFAAVSTYDFTQHLDRQMHDVHCSFIPGSHGKPGESGCAAAMMSRYSSVARGAIWGGIPISLPAMAVFGFLLFYAIDLVLSRRQGDPRATAFLALATGLPALASIAMAIVSLTQLGTVCKLCVGIYLASAACLVGAIALWREASRGGAPRAAVRRAPAKPERSEDPPWAGGPAGARAGGDVPTPTTLPSNAALERQVEPASNGYLAGAFAVGMLFVLVPVAFYAILAPDHTRFIGTCEGLAHPEDTYGIMVPMGKPAPDAAPAIEILDPLCPTCRAFEERLEGAGLAAKLARKAVLFPLDASCNWMVPESVHPGACAISEAVLCAGDRAGEVVTWAFSAQDQIKAAAKKDPAAAERIAKERFPDLASCIGSATAKSRLNKSLRWAVANGIRVLTPQLYIDGVRLCDEDIDLGVEYMVGAMLERRARGALTASRPEAPPAAPAPQAAPPPAPEPTARPPAPEAPSTGPGPAPAAPARAPAAPAAHPDQAPGPVTSPDQVAPATPPAAEPPTAQPPAPPTPTEEPAAPPATPPAAPAAPEPAPPTPPTSAGGTP